MELEYRIEDNKPVYIEVPEWAKYWIFRRHKVVIYDSKPENNSFSWTKESIMFAKEIPEEFKGCFKRIKYHSYGTGKTFLRIEIK